MEGQLSESIRKMKSSIFGGFTFIGDKVFKKPVIYHGVPATKATVKLGLELMRVEKQW